MLLVNNTYLHPIVYVLADKPAKDNINPKVPLVGTKSYKTLLNWLGQMDIDITRVRLYNQIDNPFPVPTIKHLNLAVSKGHIKIIALGKEAMEYLMERDLVEWYALPHPSPANKNAQKDIKIKLDSCRAFVYNEINE